MFDYPVDPVVCLLLLKSSMDEPFYFYWSVCMCRRRRHGRRVYLSFDNGHVSDTQQGSLQPICWPKEGQQVLKKLVGYQTVRQ